MSNNDWADTLIKLGVAGLTGYGVYKGGQYLARKALEYSEEQELQRIREAQWQRQAQQNMLNAQRREQEQLLLRRVDPEQREGFHL